MNPLSKLSEADVRREAGQSTYYMARYLLGYDRLRSEVHGRWSLTLDRLPFRRRLILRPRLTYKTTLYTVSYSLRRLWRNANLRILLVNAVHGNAAGFLREIKGHCERNDRFRHFCGDWISPKWNEGEINIHHRTLNRKEPSISIAGYGSALVSAHYDLIIIDDLVNEDDRESPRVRQKKVAWFKDCVSLLDQGGEILVVGTRWHYEDLYRWIMEELNPSLAPAERYTIESEGAYLEDGETPRYPEILSVEDLQRILREAGPINFGAQYLNNPRPPGSVVFRVEELQTFEFKGREGYETVVGFCDPAMGKSDLGCYSAVVTVGVTTQGVFHVLDASLERFPPDALLQLILHQHAYWRYDLFGLESNNFQERLVSELQAMPKAQHLRVVGVPHRGDKLARILTLHPLTARGQLRIAEDWRTRYPLLMDQLLGIALDALPAYVDGPDALEGAVSLALSTGGSLPPEDWPEDPYYAPSTRKKIPIEEYEEDPYYR